MMKGFAQNMGRQTAREDCQYVVFTERTEAAEDSQNMVVKMRE